MIRSAVLIQITRVTDGQTDGIGVAYTRYSIHAVARNTRKLCYRKDDRSMRHTYGCPENFWDSLTTPTALFPTFSRAFVPIKPMNVPTKFEVRSFTRS